MPLKGCAQRRAPTDPLIVPISGAQIRQLLQRRGPIETFFKDRMREILYESKFPDA
ncbi:MAG: putative NTPase family [Bradyrhizobium sp.]|nr:putative NTPase family [Bradyrhizobium sp.]